mmetsp:Transcript_4833/g.9034  ORF Transcript_4833/g.9034 Transcript_4833/m.9034 type:complete len:108 (+) Transcript_4833:1068-1391(+)
MKCPICKAPISEQTLIPLFTSTSDDKSENSELPKRPQPRFNTPEQAKSPSELWAESVGFGFFPSIFGLHFTQNPSFTEERLGAPTPWLVQLLMVGLGTLIFLYIIQG